MTEMTYAKPQPIPDRDSEPFWQALQEGRLALQCCNQCDTYRWPPRAICNHCYSFDYQWKDCSGRGTVVSWIVNHQVFNPAFKDDMPLTVVMVRLAEQQDILMPGGWRASRPPQSNMPVEVCLQGSDDGATLVDWQPCK